MNNGLTASNALNPENVSRDDFTSTIAAEAQRVGIYTEEDVLRIQNGLMETLSEVIGYYSENHSTSVKTDNARRFAQSILYNADTYLLSLADEMAAVEELRERRMSELYGKGYLINSRRYEQAKLLYARARHTRIKNADKDYNRILDVYLKNYLLAYDPRFNAHSKVFITLPSCGIRGAYHIGELSDALSRIINFNLGQKADVTIVSESDGEAK